GPGVKDVVQGGVRRESGEGALVLRGECLAVHRCLSVRPPTRRCGAARAGGPVCPPRLYAARIHDVYRASETCPGRQAGASPVAGQDEPGTDGVACATQITRRPSTAARISAVGACAGSPHWAGPRRVPRPGGRVARPRRSRRAASNPATATG